MSRTPGWMENNFLNVGWPALWLETMKVAEEVLVAELGKEMRKKEGRRDRFSPSRRRDALGVKDRPHAHSLMEVDAQRQRKRNSQGGSSLMNINCVTRRGKGSLL